MTHTQRLASITNELYDFSTNYKNQNEINLGEEFEDTANALNHLVKVYNYGYDGYEIDVLNKHVSQKISTLQRVLNCKSSNQKDKTTIYALGSLSNYSTIIKKNN